MAVPAGFRQSRATAAELARRVREVPAALIYTWQPGVEHAQVPPRSLAARFEYKPVGPCLQTMSTAG